MSEKTPSEILRNDKLAREAGEKIIDSFKYLAGVSWTPVVVIMAFFRSGDTEFGWFLRVVLSASVIGLMTAGAIFFLAYQKQTLMFAHALMGEEALEKAYSANSNAKMQVEQNIYVAQRLGRLANDMAFPLMTISYLALSVVAVFAVWL